VCERRLGEWVVGDPVRELRQRVGGARRDEKQVGLRQVRVEILGGRPACERQERPLGDELLRSRGDERHHVVPGFDEQARHVARLVRGDPSADTEQDTAFPRSGIGEANTFALGRLRRAYAAHRSVTYFLGYE
jgi:hypothetical protein